jgi:hypothetical protein
MLVLASCKDYDREPFNNDSAPAQVDILDIQSQPGGCKVTYSLPDDPNLLYVKAVYTLANGTVREVKSSFYKNYLILDGFFNAGEYKAKIYSVSRGEKLSAPEEITFQTEVSPIQLARQTLDMRTSYGGVSVGFKNDFEGDLRFTVVTLDSLEKEVIPVDDYYTKLQTGRFAVRGFKSEEKWFGVFISDRWGNRTDTLSGLFTPIFEQLLDRTKFKSFTIDSSKKAGNGNTAYISSFTSDAPIGHVGTKPENLWDDKYGTGDSGNTIHTFPGGTKATDQTVLGMGLPQHFSFDLGVNARLSRFRLFHRYGDGYDRSYASGDPKTYEIYGAPKGAEDDMSNWTLLLRCESVKPSGSPAGTVTAEDVQFAGKDGEEFEFPLPGGDDEIPPVQYIRVRIIELWGALDYVYIEEMKFWGEIIQ